MLAARVSRLAYAALWRCAVLSLAISRQPRLYIMNTLSRIHWIVSLKRERNRRNNRCESHFPVFWDLGQFGCGPSLAFSCNITRDAIHKIRHIALSCSDHPPIWDLRSAYNDMHENQSYATFTASIEMTGVRSGEAY